MTPRPQGEALSQGVLNATHNKEKGGGGESAKDPDSSLSLTSPAPEESLLMLFASTAAR